MKKIKLTDSGEIIFAKELTDFTDEEKRKYCLNTSMWDDKDIFKKVDDETDPWEYLLPREYDVIDEPIDYKSEFNWEYPEIETIDTTCCEDSEPRYIDSLIKLDEIVEREC